MSAIQWIQRTLVEFDRSKVAALQDNQTDLFNRANIGMSGGLLTVAQAERMVNIEPDADDDIYLRSPNIVEVPIGSTVATVQSESKIISDMAANYARGGVRRIK